MVTFSGAALSVALSSLLLLSPSENRNVADCFSMNGGDRMSTSMMLSSGFGSNKLMSPDWRQSSFVARTSSQGNGRFSRSKRSPGRGVQGLNMIFERMSEDCIGALVTAQNESARLNQKAVGCELMVIGIIDRPENARTTLKKYGISLRQAKRTVAKMYQADSEAPDFGSMFLANKKARDVELPFTSSLKRVLTQASKIADKADSPEIRSEHVLLALLSWEEEMPGESAVHLDDDGYATGALAVFLKMEAIDAAKFSPSEFCRTLISDAKENEGAELVSGGDTPRSSTPTLMDCGVDLTEAAENGELDEVFGRDKEILSCLRTLVRRRKNNPCLIGEPGVGKTAVVEGIAQILVAPKILAKVDEILDRNEDGSFVDHERFQRLLKLESLCPPRLKDYRIVSLELANLVAGTKYRGEFEERLQNIMEELTDENAPPTILFIDEIHTLVGAGSAEGGIDAANMLKPALSRGKIQVIGATTISEYRKHIEKDMALERRLQPLLVKEPSIPETINILELVAERYGSHHGVEFTPEALEAAAKLSERFITDRFLPDKALDLLDEAGALVHIEQSLGDDDDFDDPLVTEDTIAQVVAEWTSVPIGKLQSEETDRLMVLEDKMTERVKGQERAVRAVARSVRRARSGLRDTSRPIASFMFCGPTGVGKTELCKTLAETYFASEKDMVRIDMSEYMEKHSVSRLTGPPPGYVGYEEGGQLTEAVRRSPHSVVLLDELEKAHPDVLNILLQILEDGVLTDGKGRSVNFKNTILVMTSNVGSKRILEVADQRRKMKDAKKLPKMEVYTEEEKEETTTKTSTLDVQPLKPEDIMSKLQNNPEAMKLMMEAATNPDIMKAMNTAMSGSPADMLRLGRENPAVADFLKRLWTALDMSPSTDVNGKEAVSDTKKDTEAKKDSEDEKKKKEEESKDKSPNFSDLIKGKADEASNFASGLMKQFEVITGVDGKKEKDVIAVNGATATVPKAANGTSKPSADEDELDEEAVERAAAYSAMADTVKEELEASMKPELLNRIDEIVIFQPLEKQELLDIAELLLKESSKRAKEERDITLSVTDDFLERILMEGSRNSGKFGARPMRRAVQKLFEDPVSEAIISKFLEDGSTATVDIKSTSKKNVVAEITRQSDKKTFSIEIDDEDGGIGRSAKKPSGAAPAPQTTTTELTPQPKLQKEEVAPAAV